MGNLLVSFAAAIGLQLMALGFLAIPAPISVSLAHQWERFGDLKLTSSANERKDYDSEGRSLGDESH